MTWSTEEWFDSGQSLTVASAISAALLWSNPQIPVATQQNAIDLTSWVRIFWKKLLQQSFSLKSDSHLQKHLHYLLHCKPFINDENAFQFILKATFVLKIFKFLSWLFSHIEKRSWLELQG